MARIFSVLALLAMLLLAANMLAGLWIGDFNQAAFDYSTAAKQLSDVQRKAGASPEEVEAARQRLATAAAAFETPHSRIVIHRLLGVATALMAILVNSITITYFIGTSRWCKEVSDTYGLPADLVWRSTNLKRRTFPWSLGGIIMVIVLVGLGAAADPSGSNRANSANLVGPHYWAAMVGIVLIGISFWVQMTRIAENYRIIDQILANVQRVRAERGLKPLEQAAP